MDTEFLWKFECKFPKKTYKKTELNVLNSEKVSSQLSSFIEWVASSSTYWAKNLCFLVPEATGRKRALSRIFLPSLQTSQHLTAVVLHCKKVFFPTSWKYFKLRQMFVATVGLWKSQLIQCTLKVVLGILKVSAVIQPLMQGDTKQKADAWRR